MSSAYDPENFTQFNRSGAPEGPWGEVWTRLCDVFADVAESLEQTHPGLIWGATGMKGAVPFVAEAYFSTAASAREPDDDLHLAVTVNLIQPDEPSRAPRCVAGTDIADRNGRVRAEGPTTRFILDDKGLWRDHLIAYLSSAQEYYNGQLDLMSAILDESGS